MAIFTPIPSTSPPFGHLHMNTMFHCSFTFFQALNVSITILALQNVSLAEPRKRHPTLAAQFLHVPARGVHVGRSFRNVEPRAGLNFFRRHRLRTLQFCLFVADSNFRFGRPKGERVRGIQITLRTLPECGFSDKLSQRPDYFGSHGSFAVTSCSFWLANRASWRRGRR